MLIFKKVETPLEWAEYHRIRKAEVYNDLPDIVYDHEHYTLNHVAHFHFILVLDKKIIGVAQMEKLNDKEFALRPFAIDEPYHHEGHGTRFLEMLEGWVKTQRGEIIRLHSSPQALEFYTKHGYVNGEDFGEAINPNATTLKKVL